MDPQSFRTISKQSFLEDLSKAYGISSDKINIISIVPGGFQLYFTISENLSISPLLNSNFNSIKSLVGLSYDYVIIISEEEKIPDKNLAINLLKPFVSRLIRLFKVPII